MCAVRLLHNISPKCRIDFKSGGRSMSACKQMADKMSLRFQKYLLSRDGERISISEYREILRKITGKNIDLRVEQLKDCKINASISPDIKYYAYNNSSLIYTDYDGFKINVKKKKDKIVCSDSTLVHETRHLFDMMCNPKYMNSSHSQHVRNNELMSQCSKVKNFICSWGEYKPERVFGIFKKYTFEEELREKLKGLNNEIAINILQLSRYHLQSERNAYLDSDKFYMHQIVSKPKLLVPLLLSHVKTMQGLQFGEKQRTLKKIIKELIQEERFKKSGCVKD